jgi:threonylcarbamoyladenosine tRNA methylthiotransferase CDKAL1
MLRVGMTNPPYILEHLDAMVDILNHPRVYSFLHVPVQSGSNNVLDKMNREYMIEEFHEVCDFLVEHVKPEMTLATDIICGFPTETEADFEETLQLVERYKFPVINISQFYPRPGTVAAKWKKVPSADVKKRSGLVTKLFDSYTTNLHYMTEEVLVWIIGYDDRALKNQPGKLPQLLGHTKSYTKVVLDQNAESLSGQPAAALIGRVVKVKVTETQKWHITGHIIDANPEVPHVKAEEYFAQCEAQRREKEVKEGGLEKNEAKIERVIVEEKIKVKVTTQQALLHLAGMAALTVGVFATLKGIFGGAGVERASQIANVV